MQMLSRERAPQPGATVAAGAVAAMQADGYCVVLTEPLSCARAREVAWRQHFDVVVTLNPTEPVDGELLRLRQSLEERDPDGRDLDIERAVIALERRRVGVAWKLLEVEDGQPPDAIALLVLPLHGPGKCRKVPHGPDGGYLHGPEDDDPYDVDGVSYCGRCHRQLDEVPS